MYMGLRTQLSERSVVPCFMVFVLFRCRCGKHSVKSKAAFIEISLSPYVPPLSFLSYLPFRFVALYSLVPLAYEVHTLTLLPTKLKLTPSTTNSPFGKKCIVCIEK